MTGRRARTARLRLVGAGALLALIAGAAGTGLTSSATAGAAPSAEQLVRDLTIAGAVDALRANGSPLGFARGGEQDLGDALGVAVRDVVTDPDGATHVRMQRTLGGLPVLGGDLVVHRTPTGAWDGASATLRTPLTLKLNPLVPALTATATAVAGAAVSGATPVGAPTLVVDAVGDSPALAWDVLTAGTQADGTPSLLHTYVDAVTGQVRFRDEEIHTADGSGEALYLGRVPLSTELGREVYELRDLARGGNYTADAENRTDDCLPLLLPLCTSNAPSKLFTDQDNQWGSGMASDRQTTAVDAQYGSVLTWDYFVKAHERRGIANDGVGVYSRVHYGDKYANAFWNDRCRCMTYGDGDGSVLGPLVSLDIAGHEISHGVTSHTSMLMASGESGGINEATSDIFGTMIEFFANNAQDRGDYLVGEMPQRKATSSTGQPAAIRYMWKPSLDGDSPDCYSDRVANIGVHNSAGIGNHFFYLLAEGSKTKKIHGISYTSPTCNEQKVKGIGRTAAAEIWYRALVLYFTTATDYIDARTGTLKAATDLFGPKSTQVAAVAAAWDAVNVYPAVARPG